MRLQAAIIAIYCQASLHSAIAWQVWNLLERCVHLNCLFQQCCSDMLQWALDCQKSKGTPCIGKITLQRWKGTFHAHSLLVARDKSPMWLSWRVADEQPQHKKRSILSKENLSDIFMLNSNQPSASFWLWHKSCCSAANPAWNSPPTGQFANHLI